MPTRIELLWKRREAAAKQRARIYAWDLAGADGAVGDAACARAEAVVDAAYHAVENIVDEIIAAKATSVTDLAIKARVLAWYGRVEDVGYYRPKDILQFFADVQNFAAL
jgi:transcriptional regulator NrdR family protein